MEALFRHGGKGLFLRTENIRFYVYVRHPPRYSLKGGG